MSAHEFVQEWSAESPYCGAMVMRNGGGDTCGLLRDDPVHAGRKATHPGFTWTKPDGAGLVVPPHAAPDCTTPAGCEGREGTVERVCSVHECGQPAKFELVWLDRAPRAYCWPCLRSRYYREPWASARQEPLPVTR